MTQNSNTNLNWPDGFEWDDIMEMFPYDSPRDVQKTGMQTIADAVSNDGFTLMEGACGTGKTLTALAPLAALVRSRKTKFKRIVVITSVKQQQRAFEDEVEKINKKLTANGKRPLSALTLVGKADVCPYVQQDEIYEGAIYDECNTLREATVNLTKGETSGEKKSGSKLVQQAEEAYPGQRQEEPYYVFDSEVPTEDETGIEYCPYYANHLSRLADKGSSVIPYNHNSEGLVTPERLLKLAGEAGTCPHSVMGEALDKVEIVIANYYHLFDPMTVSTFTDELVDSKSIIVADEAHNIVPRVKDLLDRDKAFESFKKAQNESSSLRAYLKYDEHELEELADGLEMHGPMVEAFGSDAVAERYREIESLLENERNLIAGNVQDYVEIGLYLYTQFSRMDDIDAEKLAAWDEFLQDFRNAVNKTIETEFASIQRNGDEPEFEFEVPLREPELKPNAGSSEIKDKLSSWMELLDDPHNVIEHSDDIGTAIVGLHVGIRETIFGNEDHPEFRSSGVGSYIQMWREFDPTSYFRHIKMERSATPSAQTDYEWESDYRATLSLYNCIPKDEIANRLSEFGGGVIMSATLEPIDVYREVTGINELEAEGRPVLEEQFGLSFPEENRMSFSVEAPAFKYNNKGQPFGYQENPRTDNPVRQTYAQSIYSVVQTTPGNVLIVMPSYNEAKWAGKLLKFNEDIDASRILIDESSSNTETESMKRKFFRSDNAVMVTGALGTLTEGVDYKGDRLSAVVVCGVPIENTHNIYAKAVRTAYDFEFGRSNGFEYAFTVPAVHKVRQALGRVIRTDDDVGVRVLIDERYTENAGWDGVRKHLSPDERREFQDLDPEGLLPQLRGFWEFQQNN